MIPVGSFPHFIKGKTHFTSQWLPSNFWKQKTHKPIIVRENTLTSILSRNVTEHFFLIEWSLMGFLCLIVLRFCMSFSLEGQCASHFWEWREGMEQGGMCLSIILNLSIGLCKACRIRIARSLHWKISFKRRT